MIDFPLCHDSVLACIQLLDIAVHSMFPAHGPKSLDLIQGQIITAAAGIVCVQLCCPMPILKGSLASYNRSHCAPKDAHALFMAAVNRCIQTWSAGSSAKAGMYKKQPGCAFVGSH